MPNAVEAKLLKQDLPARDRKRVQDAVNTYYNLHVKFNKEKLSQEEKWRLFARILKNAMDRNLAAHWHVAVGNGVGYACKVRQRAMGIWKFPDGCQVVLWKSPGLEPAQPAESVAREEGGKKKAVKAKVLFGEAKAEVQAVCEEMSLVDTKDAQVLAMAIRKRLTKDFGPIWHVLAGPSFVVEMGQDCRNEFGIQVGDTRIVGFQHEQLDGGLFPSLDLPKLLSAVPYLLMLLLCFGYMALSSLCKDIPESEALRYLNQQICGGSWEPMLRNVGVVVIVSAFCSRTLPRVFNG